METVEYCFCDKFILTENQLRDISLTDKKQFDSKDLLADNIPGLKYYFCVYPRKNDNGFNDETGVFLYVKYERFVDAKFSIEVQSASFKNEHTATFTINSTTGYGDSLCSYEELIKPENKWIMDGKLTIKVTGTLTSVIPIDRSSFNSNAFLSCLWNRDDKDFTFLVDDKEIKVHKLVLANASPVFDQMLKTQWKETTESKMTIEDFHSDVVEAAVNCFYDQSILLSHQTAMELLRFADKYVISVLKNQMELYLIEKVSKSSVIKLANASVIANAEKLNQKCFEFLINGIKSNAIADIKELNADMKEKLLEEAFTCKVDCRD